jgi:lipopolysaccharide transport system ATP-binding protein
MREFVREGKTVVLVSHDLANVRGLCRQVLWLEQGRIRALGETEAVVAQYLDDVNLRAAAEQSARDRTETRGGSGDARFARVSLLDGAGYPTDLFRPGQSITVRAEYRAFRSLERPVFRFAITSPRHAVTVCAVDSRPEDIPPVVDGSGVVECTFEAPPLRPGHYSLALSILGADRIALYDALTAAGDFVVSAGGSAVIGGQASDRGDLVDVPTLIRHEASQT